MRTRALGETGCKSAGGKERCSVSAGFFLAPGLAAGDFAAVVLREALDSDKGVAGVFSAEAIVGGEILSCGFLLPDEDFAIDEQ